MGWNPLNFLTGTPFGGALTGLAATLDQMRNFRAAAESNAAAEAEVRGILGPRVTQSTALNREFGTRQTAESIRVRDNIDRMMKARRDAGMGYLDRYGDQMLDDTRQQFGNQLSQANAQLAGSGMSGTALGAGVRSGFATAETNARNRALEQIATTKANAYTGLEGERINALSAGEGNVMGTRENQYNRLLDTYLNTTGDMANFIQSINRPYPDNSDLLQRLGAAAVDPPKRSGTGPGWATGINVMSDMLSAPGMAGGAAGQAFGG